MKVTIRQCAAALRKHGGIVGAAARALDIDPTTLRARIANHEVLQRAKAEGEEVVKDKAENNVVDDINSGNVSSSKWYLAQKAKERGYGKIVLDDEQLEKLISGATPDDLKKIAEGE